MIVPSLDYHHIFNYNTTKTHLYCKTVSYPSIINYILYCLYDAQDG